MLTHDVARLTNVFQQFQPCLVPALGAEDDVNLWSTAIAQIIADAEFLCRNATTTQTIITKIGRCSHWLRPNQSRWTADGGFAWPSGYGGSGYSRHGLPEFDWSLMWTWNPTDDRWDSTTKASGKRPIQLRIAIPSRSARHQQVAVHTLWSPGSPTFPGQKLTQFYGFRLSNGTWKATAYQGSSDDAYNCASSGDLRA